MASFDTTSNSIAGIVFQTISQLSGNLQNGINSEIVNK